MDSGPITIIGLGGIGNLFAAAAARASSIPPNVVARGATASAIRKSGLRWSGAFGEVVVAPGGINLCESMDQISGQEQRFIVIATKAHQVADVVRDLAVRPDMIGAATQIVLVQNGWGIEDAVSHLVSSAQILRALVTTGAHVVAAGHSHVDCHVCPIAIGRLHGGHDDSAIDLASALTSGGLPVNAVSDVCRRLWQKFLCNVAVNATGAALGMTIGDLAANELIRRLMDMLIAEAWCVMEAEGHSAQQATLAGFKEYFHSVFVPATSDHRSSMEPDYLAGRKTEVDYLNGAIVRLAQEHGWVAGVNRLLCDTMSGRARLVKAA